MRYYRLMAADGGTILAVEAQDGLLVSLTSIDDRLTDISQLIFASSLTSMDMDTVAQQIVDSGNPDTFGLVDLTNDSREGTGDLWLDLPFDPPEVWAAGVTYKSSEMERRRESDTPDVYSKVYSADRPELFFKATAERCVGPFESVGIREDSKWNVPEPELAFVLYQEEIVGYTAGNDMSSRSIEGENPLYLPQAKIYSRSCALGPCFVSAGNIDPQNVSVESKISRDQEVVFSGQTSTSQMARGCEEIAGWLTRHNEVPDMTTVLTGTSIVPPPEFSLQEGDIVSITIEGVGTLENPAVFV